MVTSADLPKTDLGVEPLLGRFRIVREIGRGGMGRVLEARDNELKRPVAIKLIQPLGGAPLTPELLARFAAEAQVTAQLNHPNIVPVHEIGRAGDGALYFVMRLVRGRSLAEVIDEVRTEGSVAREEWTRPRLLNAFVQACNGVAYAHSRGVLHRDLKPANIMLGRFGEVLVMDWGVSRVVGRRADRRSSGTFTTSLLQTQAGSTVGTPGYMSPEQIRGETVDERADVWSLGSMLYEILTYQPAYAGTESSDVLDGSLAGLPPNPQVRAPHLGIESEIAEIALRALSLRPSGRYRNAAHLAEVVRAFLEGTRRRDRARLSVTEAESGWRVWRGLVAERRGLRKQLDELSRLLAPWESLRRKTELLKARERLAELEVERVRVFGSLVRAAEQALAQDPKNLPARQILGRAYLERFEEAEEAGDTTQALYFEERVRAYDDGRHSAVLEGTGSLSLRTDPPGAEITCQRFMAQRLRWRLDEPQTMGRTPQFWTPIEMGSYVLTLKLPDRPAVRYPVHIARRTSWDSGDLPVRLPTAEEVGKDFVYVPAGPFMAGGDPEADSPVPRGIRSLPGFVIGRFPITCDEYAEFLADLSADDAARHHPRDTYGAQAAPEGVDAGRLPVTGVSWHDAVAYCAWRSAKDGRSWQLPQESWWEKTARGVDGRFFPWGSRFDPTLTKMRDSRPGPPRPEPVGVFTDDVSVYGARDLAGGIREWCGDEVYLADPGRRPIRGGSWSSVARECRCANRWGAEPEDVFLTVGFRLARRL